MSNKKKLLYLTNAEFEGIGTWYEYLAKYKLFKKLENIKTVLVAGLPQEYGLSVDMLIFALNAKLTVVDDRKEKLNQFFKIAENFGVAHNVKIILCKNLTKYPFKDNTFDLVSNTEVIQRVKNYKTMIKEMERVSKKNVMLFVPNGYYYSHYIITKIKTFRLKNLLKDCNLRVVNYNYLDRPPWPAGISVSAEGVSFAGGSKAKEKEEFEKQGIKEGFFISLLKKIFTFLTPALVSLEFLYFPPFRQLFSHMFYIHEVKDNSIKS